MTGGGYVGRWLTREQWADIEQRMREAREAASAAASPGPAWIAWNDQRPYQRPERDDLAWPLMNGTWPIDTPSAVLGDEPEE